AHGPDKANALFERYHELVPGIGAFAIRPAGSGQPPHGLSCLVSFIRDLLTHQLNRFSQSYRISTTTEEIIRDEPLDVVRGDAVSERVSLPASSAILGYMKKADIAGFARRKLFYCRATDDDGKPLSLDISAAQGAVLIGWWGPRTGGPYLTTNWL